MLESEPTAMAGRLQPWCSVNEKDRVVDEMFLTEFRKEHPGQRLYSRRIKPHMEQAIGVGIDSSVQPISIIIKLNHSLIDRNVIRLGPTCRL